MMIGRLFLGAAVVLFLMACLAALEIMVPRMVDYFLRAMP